jgi:hypothetical protein
VTVATALPNGFGVGDQVVISRVVGASQINGTFNIIGVVDANHFVIALNQIMGAYIGGGTVNKQNYALGDINTGQIMRVNTHRAGRPFDSLRGRRRGRTRR